MNINYLGQRAVKLLEHNSLASPLLAETCTHNSQKTILTEKMKLEIRIDARQYQNSQT